MIHIIIAVAAIFSLVITGAPIADLFHQTPSPYKYGDGFEIDVWHFEKLLKLSA